MDTLVFIDNMFQTQFSKNIQGLNEFLISQKYNTSFYKNIFLAAARNLKSLNIYKDFRKAVENKEYNSFNLVKFVTDTFAKDAETNKREYFKTYYNGD